MEHCSFATVPLHVSPSTPLTCLTYELTKLNFCRSSRRLSVLFAAHQLFLHFMHTFSCFYYKNLYNISGNYILEWNAAANVLPVLVIELEWTAGYLIDCRLQFCVSDIIMNTV